MTPVERIEEALRNVIDTYKRRFGDGVSERMVGPIDTEIVEAIAALALVPSLSQGAEPTWRCTRETSNGEPRCSQQCGGFACATPPAAPASASEPTEEMISAALSEYNLSLQSNPLAALAASGSRPDLANKIRREAMADALRAASPVSPAPAATTEPSHYDERDAGPVPWAELDAALAEHAAAVPMTREPMTWQPIETAPKDGTQFLAWWVGGPGFDSLGVLMTHWMDNSKTTRPWAGWKVPSNTPRPPGARPTHWMPLPAAPSGDAGKGV